MPLYSEISVSSSLVLGFLFFFFFGLSLMCSLGFPGGSVVKNPPANAGDADSIRVRKLPWKRKWQSTPVFLPGKFHRQKSLAGYSPCGPIELDTTEWLNNNNVHFEASPNPVRRVPCYLHQESDSRIRKHSGKKPRFLGGESARNSAKST